MSNNATTMPVTGWGNLEPKWCHVYSPQSETKLRTLLACQEQSTYIARGLGRSYGDSSVNSNAGVLIQTGINRFLDFDQKTGVVQCEAGVSLSAIIEVVLPTGWFLSTTPGTQFVTLGGAIASDVHGKNHHRSGSFGNSVRRLRLLTADGEILTCSPSENKDLFWATVGGMGLTGIILEAHIQLVPVETCYCHVTYRRTQHLEETLDCFADTDGSYRYSVAWVDSLARGKSLGRSVVMLANDASVGQLSSKRQSTPLILPSHSTRSVPCYLPCWTLNSFSIRVFNEMFYRTHQDKSEIIDFRSFFYPLDSISTWNRIYGKRGFIQYQAFFPKSESRRGLVELMTAIVDSRQASFLAVLKSCGPGNQGMLSFLEEGHTMALDLPNRPGLRQLVRQLDTILLKHGGRLYLAKDALMDAATFSAMYPMRERFLRIKEDVDPGCRYNSNQAQRIGLCT